MGVKLQMQDGGTTDFSSGCLRPRVRHPHIPGGQSGTAPAPRGQTETEPLVKAFNGSELFTITGQGEEHVDVRECADLSR